ncbi:hypothetical protein F5Y08DRAFT_197887 [Xylaria arbuscula]|nr:hypothetical protein F5Y08DRAFT_197887 [Xylaria arbuscula]
MADMEAEAADRFEAELDLLLAMYPDSLSFSTKGRELKYSHRHDESSSGAAAVLILRLPDTYPLAGFPEIVSATGHHKEDLRSATQAVFSSTEAPPGEEVLDVLLLAFTDLAVSRKNPDVTMQAPEQPEPKGTSALVNRTVIIWLHHLLNTNKRKLALNPSVAASNISGVTKPGYPGVLIFSGERSAIDSHVLELRNQRWQAFQIRYDTDSGEGPSEIWKFKHGTGISEVGSMSDVAQSIVDAQQREVFLVAIGVK